MQILIKRDKDKGKEYIDDLITESKELIGKKGKEYSDNLTKQLNAMEKLEQNETKQNLVTRVGNYMKISGPKNILQHN